MHVELEFFPYEEISSVEEQIYFWNMNLACRPMVEYLDFLEPHFHLCCPRVVDLVLQASNLR